jgi:molecular chaperone GrpE
VKKADNPSKDGANGAAQPDAATAADQMTPAADELQAQLEAARQEAAANLEGWQRALAEFQNYRRRTERESKDSYQNATADVLKALLPIVDDFERALERLPANVAGEPWLSGVQLIHRKFLKLLEDFEVSPLDPAGQPFDPIRHQALGTDDDSDLPGGTVTQTLQKGYVAGERVLRPALVRVAS